MTDYTAQILRIKEKLLEAKKADPDLKVFGAKSHKYHLNPPATEAGVQAFEQKYDLKLPDCYRSFVTQVGNGGISHDNQGAGPFYGIYPLGEKIDELIYADLEKYLKGSCAIYPNMSDAYWDSLIANIEKNKEITDEEYDKELGKIFGGVLIIGSQGCTYLHGLILSGPVRGRVVNLEMERQKPKFTYESNFLDWYERWLDEVIDGQLITEGASWFGYVKGGTEEDLLEQYISAKDDGEKQACLNGLLNKKALKAHTLDKIEELINDNNNTTPLSTLVQLLCKSDYKRAKPYLLSLIKSDLLAVFQTIYWYAKSHSKEWQDVIQENIHRIDDKETLRFCGYILQETGGNYDNLIVPFTKHENKEIRSLAIYILGKQPNNETILKKESGSYQKTKDSVKKKWYELWK